MYIREAPPLYLYSDVVTPDNVHHRWADDGSNPANIISDLNFSTTTGGFEQMSCKIMRDIMFDYTDLTEYATITVYGAGDMCAWQGRLEAAPRQSGSDLYVAPAAVGWQKHLQDDKSVRISYIDSDVSHWQGPSDNRQTDLVATVNMSGPKIVPATTSSPPWIALGLTGVWSGVQHCEAWYDAKSLPIGTLYYTWKKGNANIWDGDNNWYWSANITTNDAGSAGTTSTGNLKGVGGSLVLPAQLISQTYAYLVLYYNLDTPGSGGEGIEYPIWWKVAVTGKHDLPMQGTWPDSIGLFASDIVRHAVNNWAPKLSTVRNGIDTIAPTSLIIPQAWFGDTPTTVGKIIDDVLKYENVDWWVDEGPTFNLAYRSNHGRDWRARVGPSGLQEVGPEADRICNHIIVAFNDSSGSTYTVGPTGSKATIISDALFDADESNLATAAGLTVYPDSIPNIGIGTPEVAIGYGQSVLTEMRGASTAGQADIVAYVEDANTGVVYPSYVMRYGDRITFTDAHDTTPRRIVRTQYANSTKTNRTDLDSAPQDLDATLARMSIGA